MRTRGSELSVRDTAVEAVRLYLRHWKLLAPLTVIILLPQTILGAAIAEIQIDRVETAGDVLKLLTIPTTLVVSLGGEALLAGVITGLVLEWRAHRPLPGLAAFLRSLPWVSLIAVDLLLAIGGALGLVLLVLPGLIFITYFAIAPPVIEIERRRVRDALRRSAALVRGHFRSVFILIIGAILITEGIAQALLLAFHDFVPEIASEIAVDALLESAQALIVSLIAISLIELRGDKVPALPHTPA